MNIFLWHVHGSWTTSFVQGGHNYYVPALPDRGPDGLGRARTWEWPLNVVEVSPEDAADLDVDVAILQRKAELLDLAPRWLGRVPGKDVPTIYLEHNCPPGPIARRDHPAAGRSDLVVVHVTYFNDLLWDMGSTRTVVIEHGIVDPGYRYSGEIERIGVCINDPIRRGHVTGTDLLPFFRRIAPIDLFGMNVAALGGYEDLPQSALHDELPRRRVYVHTSRWTSLGLSLLEAMHLGMPVAALATTEHQEAVPPTAGVVSNRMDVLDDGIRAFMRDPELAVVTGKRAREAASGRYGLERFLSDWDSLLGEVVTPR